MCSFLPLRTVHADVVEKIGLNSRKTERLNPLECLLPLPFTALMNDFFFFFNYSFPPQMSLMERSAVRPITAVAWTSNSSTCPRDFSLVGEKPKSYNLTKSGHFPLFFSFFICLLQNHTSKHLNAVNQSLSSERPHHINSGNERGTRQFPQKSCYLL